MEAALSKETVLKVFNANLFGFLSELDFKIFNFQG
jgi:hypothetical protein